MAKFAVLLAGSGRMDGSEIHESTLTLLYLKQAGADYQCFALDAPQASVVDHLTNRKVEGEMRNQLVESARIARGDVKPLKELNVDDFDGYVQPGGGGTVANLSDAAGNLNSLVREKIRAFHAVGKPLGFICIAPVMAAAALGDKRVTLTIGNDADAAGKIESYGAIHEVCAVDRCVTDVANRVVSTPAYMLGPTIADVAAGIHALCDKLVAMASA